MGCPVFLMPYRLAAILFGRGYQVTGMRKRGRRIEITVQESRGFRVRALQRRVLAEKTVGTLLLDNLPSAFGLPQEAHQVPHSANEARGRNLSGIRAGTGLPKQRQAGCTKWCGGVQWHFTAFQ